MNNESTGHCPLNCRRTARPVRFYFFNIKTLNSISVLYLGCKM